MADSGEDSKTMERHTEVKSYLVRISIIYTTFLATVNFAGLTLTLSPSDKSFFSTVAAFFFMFGIMCLVACGQRLFNTIYETERAYNIDTHENAKANDKVRMNDHKTAKNLLLGSFYCFYIGCFFSMLHILDIF